MTIKELFALEPHGPDTFVGVGYDYPWGGLYGGHIVAQALWAAAATVDPTMKPHSLRAYFIRRGDRNESVRYEVDRIRNGKSFATRRVVARQSNGAILNMEASFQVEEDQCDVQSIAAPSGIPGPDESANTAWAPSFDRRWIDYSRVPATGRDGSGRSLAWFRIVDDLGAADDASTALLNRCALTYLSDDIPTDAVVVSHPDISRRAPEERNYIGASLDHTIWFHRPARMDQWHLFETACHSIGNSRGLSIGHVFSQDGTLVATLAQEVLIRDLSPFT